MTQQPNKPINLSVHESSDPSLISPNPDREASVTNDLNDSAHDDDNVDVLNPGLSDTGNDENLVGGQTNTSNISAG